MSPALCDLPLLMGVSASGLTAGMLVPSSAPADAFVALLPLEAVALLAPPRPSTCITSCKALLSINSTQTSERQTSSLERTIMLYECAAHAMYVDTNLRPTCAAVLLRAACMNGEETGGSIGVAARPAVFSTPFMIKLTAI